MSQMKIRFRFLHESMKIWKSISLYLNTLGKCNTKCFADINMHKTIRRYTMIKVNTQRKQIITIFKILISKQQWLTGMVTYKAPESKVFDKRSSVAVKLVKNNISDSFKFFQPCLWFNSMGAAGRNAWEDQHSVMHCSHLFS